MPNQRFGNEDLQQHKPLGKRMILRVERLRTCALKTQHQREVVEPSHPKIARTESNLRQTRKDSQVRNCILFMIHRLK